MNSAHASPSPLSDLEPVDEVHKWWIPNLPPAESAELDGLGFHCVDSVPGCSSSFLDTRCSVPPYAMDIADSSPSAHHLIVDNHPSEDEHPLRHNRYPTSMGGLQIPQDENHPIPENEHQIPDELQGGFMSPSSPIGFSGAAFTEIASPMYPLETAAAFVPAQMNTRTSGYSSIANWDGVGDTTLHAQPVPPDVTPGARQHSPAQPNAPVPSTARPRKRGAAAKVSFCQHPGCTYGPATTYNLRQHTRAVHRGERPFECPHCPAALGKKHDLTRHIQSYHTDLGSPRRNVPTHK